MTIPNILCQNDWDTAMRGGLDSFLQEQAKVPTYVYRLYGLDRELIYVGISSNALHRFEQHRKSKSWWNEIDYIIITGYDCRAAAEAEESKAIATEEPRENIAPGSIYANTAWMSDAHDSHFRSYAEFHAAELPR